MVIVTEIYLVSVLTSRGNWELIDIPSTKGTLKLISKGYFREYPQDLISMVEDEKEYIFRGRYIDIPGDVTPD